MTRRADPPVGGHGRVARLATARRSGVAGCGTAGQDDDGSGAAELQAQGGKENTLRPRLLDLFCGAGGAGMGYYRAGFDVTGVDLRPMPRYPFTFHQADALAYVAEHGHEFDAIHASPPCQGYSRLRHLPWLKDRTWPLLIEPCRTLLEASDRDWVLENVADAPLSGITLCGLAFELPLYRHRLFESSVMLLAPPHQRHRVVIGHGRMVNDRGKGTLNASSAKGAWRTQTIITVAGGQFRKADGALALGIDWMTKAELAESIPPAYTRFIGGQLLAYVGAEVAV